MRKDRVNIAAKFAVASELCRRNIYDQVRLDFRERKDLAITDADGSIRVEVKGKQGDVWPACRGISGRGVILVLVDFSDKSVLERPDFYILTESEWRKVVEQRVESLRRKGKRMEIDADNIAINWSDLNARGKPYKGIDARPSAMRKHLERWDKITNAGE